MKKNDIKKSLATFTAIIILVGAVALNVDTPPLLVIFAINIFLAVGLNAHRLAI